MEIGVGVGLGVGIGVDVGVDMGVGLADGSARRGLGETCGLVDTLGNGDEAATALG